MKVKDLIEKLKGFEDFEIEGVFVDTSNPDSKFMNVQTFKINDVGDIGYSSKVIQLDLE